MASLRYAIRAFASQGDAPQEILFKMSRLIDDLNAAHPEDFDKTYAKQQVTAHQKADELFTKYAAKGDDAVVKAFAVKTLPVIKQHLEAAMKLPQ